MDRNAFALIAGTVFLLFIINAVVQMQTAMVREAAGGVSVDYAEATWESAGDLHLLKNEETTSTLGVYTDPEDLQDAIDKDGTLCTLTDSDQFRPQGDLELDFYNPSVLEDDDVEDFLTDCDSGGYIRSVPLYIGSEDNVLWGGVERHG